MHTAYSSVAFEQLVRSVRKTLDQHGTTWVGDLMRSRYRFELEHYDTLPIRYSARTGEPTRYAVGRRGYLLLRTQPEQDALRHYDGFISRLLSPLPSQLFAIDRCCETTKRYLEVVAELIAERYPLSIEAWALTSEMHRSAGRYAEGLAVIEPIVRALFALVPTDGLVHIEYMRGNRSFVSAAHTCLFLLHYCNRHSDADALAKRMITLDPEDPVQFRFLVTRAARRRTLALLT